MRQPGFFDVDDRLKRLSDLGDQLEAFLSMVDCENFRADLVSALEVDPSHGWHHRSKTIGLEAGIDPMVLV